MRTAANALALVLFGIGALSCSRFSQGFPLGEPRPATSGREVVVLDAAPDKAFEVVGKVHSHCRRNWFFGWGAGGREAMVAALKEEAAKLGAQGIMDVQKLGFSQFEWTDIHYYATALRWK
jgi:hypothetical protein